MALTAQEIAIATAQAQIDAQANNASEIGANPFPTAPTTPIVINQYSSNADIKAVFPEQCASGIVFTYYMQLARNADNSPKMNAKGLSYYVAYVAQTFGEKLMTNDTKPVLTNEQLLRAGKQADPFAGKSTANLTSNVSAERLMRCVSTIDANNYDSNMYDMQNWLGIGCKHFTQNAIINSIQITHDTQIEYVGETPRMNSKQDTYYCNKAGELLYEHTALLRYNDVVHTILSGSQIVEVPMSGFASKDDDGSM